MQFDANIIGVYTTYKRSVMLDGDGGSRQSPHCLLIQINDMKSLSSSIKHNTPHYSVAQTL